MTDEVAAGLPAATVIACANGPRALAAQRDGVLEPERGALRPDASRPGLGLELRRADAERWAL